MNVLQLYRTYMPESHGGVEESIRQICIATSRYGARHRVLTLARIGETEVLERPEATVIRAPLQWEPASCSIGAALFRLYREQAKWADVIHVHYPWPFADLLHVMSGAKKPVVVTYHSDIVRQGWLEYLYHPLRMLFFRQVAEVAATSPNYQDSSAFLAHLRAKTSVIPLGLSPESYEPASKEAREYVAEHFGRDFFLFIGVLRYYKGLHTLLDAAGRSGLRVVIAGKGPEEQGLRAAIRGRHLDKVQMAGFVSDDVKSALLEACRAVVFPSSLRSEAFGVTLLEGQLHGKPLISCEIGTGTSYVNVHGETGLVIPPGDGGELALAMRRLAVDDELVERMGRAARNRLNDVFSGDAVGSAYVRLYEKVLGRGMGT